MATTRYQIITSDGQVLASYRTLQDAKAGLAFYREKYGPNVNARIATAPKDNRW